MIKVNYDSQTTLVKGYYPDSIGYASIPEPFVEISEEDYSSAQGKTMCVVDGEFKEYKLSTKEKLDQGKNSRINSRLTYLGSTDWYIAREADIPDSYPIEIKNKRIQARDEINQIQAATTLTQLQQFSETFE